MAMKLTYKATSPSLLALLWVTTFCILARPTLANLDGDEDGVDMVESHGALRRNCDFTNGRWVYDDSYPLYNESCPYLSTEFSCRRNGRPDFDYEKWRWKPQHCLMPRFNALDFLGKIRKKRVMLVGDSIMRNQWESLVCLVESVIPIEGKLASNSNGPSMAFHALDFEASIEFFWAPLLVELKEDEQGRRVVHLDSIEENAKYWRGVNVLVFDSAHWWTHAGKWSSWDYYAEGGRLYTDLNPVVAYEKGLVTWAEWVDMNLDPRRTQVIFRSPSSRHNRDDGWQCYKKEEPKIFSGYKPRVPIQLVVLREVVKRMSFPVNLQEITTMSRIRQDGHPSVFSTSYNSRRTHGSDCSHWCLPGVPDSWNEMLYALLY